jgi:hypothetical protein
VNQWLNPLKRDTGSNLADAGRTAAHADHQHGGWRLRSRSDAVGEEATRKACGVLVARLQGKSWAPTPSIDHTVNVGTTREPPSPPSSQGGGGQARCRPMTSGWGGGSVVVRGRESRPHGEGTQRASSSREGMPGGRR